MAFDTLIMLLASSSMDGHPTMEDTGSPTIIRPAVATDAIAIVDLHFAAVHHTASMFYPPEVLDSWSRRPDEARYQRMRKAIAEGDELVLVAEEASDVVAFGSIVPRLRELRAVYVHPRAGRRGVGSHVLSALEHLALERGVSRLEMDASVNAEAFYRRAGYDVVQRGVHRFSDGQVMACVRMLKDLAR